MSDTDALDVSYAVEASYGVVPAVAFKRLRFTSESLGMDTEFRDSAEITPDRQITARKRVNISVAGDLGFEFSYLTFDDILPLVLLSSDYSAAINVTGTFDMAAADNSINRSAGSFVTDGFTVNRWIKTSAFTTAANNGHFKIVSVTATKMVLSHGTVVNESGSGDENIKSNNMIVNGSNKRSMLIEKEFTDLSNEFSLLKGLIPSTMALNVGVNDFIGGTISFLGKDEVSGTATASTGAKTNAPTSDVLNAVDNVVAVKEGTDSFGVTSFSFTLNNNLRSRLQVATFGAISIAAGKIDLTGTIQAYYTSKTIIDKYLNGNATSLSLIVKDDSGNSYVFDIPRVRFSRGRRNPSGGPNTDVLADLSFSAEKHPTEGVTIRIQRFAA